MTSFDQIQAHMTQRLLRHALRMAPARQKVWAIAMQSEFIEIADDREQFLWAVGCVWFSYAERINIMRDSFHAFFDYAFGTISILLGLLFLSPLFGFVFHVQAIYRGARPQWMPAILLGLALIGAIELIGGVEKILRSHKQRSLPRTHEA